MPGFPPSLVSKYVAELQELLEDVASCTDQEMSEGFERVGIGHYFSGVYGEAAYHFAHAIRYHDSGGTLKSDRASVRIRMYLGLAYFRLGDPVLAEKYLNESSNIGVKHGIAKDLQLLCQSNMAIVQIQQQNYEGSIRTCKTAMDTSLELHGESSTQYRDSCRLMISVYVRCRELHKAERALETHKEHFSREEYALFKAGFKFHENDRDGAMELLTACRDDLAELREANEALSFGHEITPEVEAKWAHVDTSRQVSAVLEAEIDYNISVINFLARDYQGSLENIDRAVGTLEDYQKMLKSRDSLDDGESTAKRKRRPTTPAAAESKEGGHVDASTAAAKAKDEKEKADEKKQIDDEKDHANDDKSEKSVVSNDIESSMVPIIAAAHMATARAEMGLLQGCFDAGLYVQATAFGDVRDKARRLAAVFEQESRVAAAKDVGPVEGGGSEVKDAKEGGGDGDGDGDEMPLVEVSDPRKDFNWADRDTNFLTGMANTIHKSMESVLGLTKEANKQREEVLKRMDAERLRRQELGRKEEEKREAVREKVRLVEEERAARAREVERLQKEKEADERRLAEELAEEERKNREEFGEDLMDVDDGAGSKAGRESENNYVAGSKAEDDMSVGEASAAESKNGDEEADAAKEEQVEIYFKDDPELLKLRNYRNADEILAKNLAGVYSQLMLLVGGETAKAAFRASRALTTRYGAYVPSLQDVMAAKNSGSKLQSTVMGGVGTGGQRAEQCSVRAELFPTVPRFAADESLYWIQWAIASTNGLGFGFMAHDGSFSKDVTYEYLREIRQMLVQVERDIKPSETATKMLLTAALAKLSSQINHKADTDSYTKRFEVYAKEIDDPLYQAIARRFRIDFLEWEIFNQQAGEMLCKRTDADSLTPGPSLLLKHLGALQELLPTVKEYVRFAEKAKDAHILRDALKRCANVYFEIDSMPDPFGSDNPERGSEEDAHNYDEMEMEVLEDSEPVWLRKFSRYRGQQLIKRMIECGVGDKLPDPKPVPMSVPGSPSSVPESP